MEVSLQEILQARETRACQQKQLLAQYGKPVLSFTMNIPGPVKCNEEIIWGFGLGNRQIALQISDLPVLHQELHTASTGCEALYVVDAPAEELKRRAVQVEDSTPVARLFDMDVLDIDGRKLERAELGFSPRTCLLCEKPAHLCGRSRAHSVEALQEKVHTLLQEAIAHSDCAHLARLAQQSLLYEACTTPKPGLVDCRNSGSHKDMDIFTFMASAAALQPYFYQCAQLGRERREDTPQALFSQLRLQGKEAEQEMYAATNGVNTHKGAIFSLGILCAAAGRLPLARRTPKEILQLCKEMTCGLSQADFGKLTEENATTAGERFYAKYGISGVRGQAEAGFPEVLELGLPILEEGLRQGKSLNEAGCGVLLSFMATVADTTLIQRGGMATQKAVAEKIGALLKETPYPSWEQLCRLDDEMIEKNLSAGGCADLLALTYFLHFLKNEECGCKP